MNDENFEKLRVALSLKNHETPPPGYFNRLPGKILARIEASELASQSTWWDWVVERFDARPLLACAYGFTISGLLLMGFRVSQLLQADAKAETTPSFGGTWLAAGPDPITTQPGSFLQSHFANPATGLANLSSVQPVIQDARPAQSGNMFQPVSYSFAH